MAGGTTVIDIIAQVTDKTVNGVNSAIKNISKLEKSVSNVIKQMEGWKGKSKLEIKAELKDMATKGITSIWNAGKKIAGKTWNIAVKLTDMATAPLKKIWDLASNPITQMVTLTGVSVGAADTINTYKSFEQGMANVKAISGATGPEFEALTEKAKELGETTRYSASEAAGAMENLAMAGWKSDAIIEGMPGLLDLAAAGSVDLATASDVVASALAQFGYEADEAGRVADVLAATASNSKTDVQGLGESLKYAGPLAGALGYSIEDVSLAFGLMGNSAIDASSAGTALRGMLARMAKQGELTEEESNAVADAMKRVGVSMTDSQGKSKPLMTVMKDLRAGFSQLTEAEKTEVAANLAGQNAMSGLLAIVNASDEDFDKLTTAITNSKDAAQKMADTKMDTLEGSIYYLQSAVEGVQIAIGEKVGPMFRGIVDSVTAAMPSIQKAVEGALGWLEGKVKHFQTLFANMLNSDEWENADFGGKLNIAWDTLIAKPFLDWWDASGKNTIFKAIGSIFSEAGKILPGGEEAGLTSWISAGAIVKAAEPVVNTVRTIITELYKISPAAGAWGMAAAAIGAAVGAIATAIESYNQQEISDNLEEHFGHMALSVQEARTIAEQTLSAPWTVNMDLALGELRNAEKVRTDAEEQLKTMKKLEWESNLGIKLGEAEAEEFLASSEAYIEDKKTELESKTYEVNLNTSIFLGKTQEGEDLSAKIAEWATEDMGEMDRLSQEISDKVGEAIKDGIIDADEQAAISALQEKMDNIVSGWYDAQAKAQMDLIQQKYGSMGVEQLTEGGFRELMSALNDQNETQEASLDESYTSYVGSLYSMLESGRITKEEFDTYKGITDQNYLNQRASNRGQSMQVGVDTLNNAYSEKIGENSEAMEDAMNQSIENLEENIEAGMPENIINRQLARGFESLNMGEGKASFLGKDLWVNDADQAGLNSMLDVLEPDASKMRSLMSEYQEKGQAVPQAFKDSYYEAMELMASAGDSNAAMETYMHRLAESGNQAIIDAVNEMAEEGALSEDLADAWERALLSTTDEGVEIDSPELQLNADPEIENKDEWTEKLHEIEQNLAEGEVGTITAETDADFTVTVDKGDCLSQIGEAVGVDWHEIAEYNGIEDPYIIYPDMEIKIPKVSMEGGGVEEGTGEESGASAGTVEATTEVTVQAGVVDSTEAYETAQEETTETFAEPYPTDGSTDVTLTQTNNAPEIYNQTASEVRTAYNTPIPASATVNVTLKWNLLNPSRSIEVTGSGSGTGSLSATLHAEGGIMTSPHLGLVAEDGAEAIIPLSAEQRGRGLQVWEQAGEMLGVSEYTDAGTAEAPEPIFADNESAGGEGEPGGAAVVVENINFEVNIDGADVQDPQALADAIRENVNSMTDDIAYQLAAAMKQAYSNTPRQAWGT